MTTPNGMPEEQQPNQQQIPIKLSDEQAQGRYANQMMIRHTPEEFIVDFFNFFPGDSQATVVSRIIMAPGQVKRAIAALQDNLKKYEQQFKTSIQLSEEPPHNFGFDMKKAE